jgi:hypothetical protein
VHGAPQKVAWYFPLIPRLRHFFASSKDAELLRWHKEGCKIDNYRRHPVDSTQSHNIDWKYKVFSDDPRSLRFALSIDGMNPFGQINSPSHYVACCSARLLIYRVAIPCLDSVKGKNIALVA